MSWKSDNAPIGITCPLIDEVQGIMESPDWNLYDEDEADFSREFKKGLETLELIRESNAILRSWGNDLYLEKEDLEKEIDYLKEQMEVLKQEVTEEKENAKYWEKQYEKEYEEGENYKEKYPGL